MYCEEMVQADQTRLEDRLDWRFQTWREYVEEREKIWNEMRKVYRPMSQFTPSSVSPRHDNDWPVSFTDDDDWCEHMMDMFWSRHNCQLYHFDETAWVKPNDLTEFYKPFFPPMSSLWFDMRMV